MYANTPSCPTFCNSFRLFPGLCKSVQNASGRPRERPTTLKPFRNVICPYIVFSGCLLLFAIGFAIGFAIE